MAGQRRKIGEEGSGEKWENLWEEVKRWGGDKVDSARIFDSCMSVWFQRWENSQLPFSYDPSFRLRLSVYDRGDCLCWKSPCCLLSGSSGILPSVLAADDGGRWYQGHFCHSRLFKQPGMVSGGGVCICAGGDMVCVQHGETKSPEREVCLFF